MANFMFTRAVHKVTNQTLNLATATLKAMLVTAGTIDEDATTLAGAGATEFAGSPYTRQTLANVTITEDTANDKSLIKCDPITFAGIDGGSAIVGMIVYNDDDANDQPVFWYDVSHTPNGNDLEIDFSATHESGTAAQVG